MLVGTAIGAAQLPALYTSSDLLPDPNNVRSVPSSSVIVVE